MLRDARERYDVPVVEVIQPAVRRAVRVTRTGRVGVIGTRATVDERGVRRRLRRRAATITLVQQACPRFVEFVEAGVTGGAELQRVAHEYLDPIAEQGVDTARARLHALPAADRRHLLRHGRGRRRW